jgi:hypothetical protein
MLEKDFARWHELSEESSQFPKRFLSSYRNAAARTVIPTVYSGDIVEIAGIQICFW